MLTCPPSLSRRPPAALGCPTRVMWPGLPNLRDAHCRGWWRSTFPAGGSSPPGGHLQPHCVPKPCPASPSPDSHDLLWAPKCTGCHWAPDPAWFRRWREAHLPTHALLTAWPLDSLCSWAWAAGTETRGEGGDDLFHGTGCCPQELPRATVALMSSFCPRWPASTRKSSWSQGSWLAHRSQSGAGLHGGDTKGSVLTPEVTSLSSQPGGWAVYLTPCTPPSSPGSPEP